MKLLPLLCALGLSCAALPASAADKPAPAAAMPKLVLVLVVDGLPNEQVMRNRAHFQGGFKTLLQNGASFSDAHQAHGITFTAVGHAAILSGAYPSQHGVISNGWIDNKSKKPMYCTQDTRYQYLGEETKESDGTSPANLRVSTLGDELRYASGNQAKVIAVSGKDRGAILLAGKAGQAYMYMGKSGNFASSSYYMAQHPSWVQKYAAAKPQDRFYGKPWCLAQPPAKYAAYSGEAPQTKAACPHGAGFEEVFVSKSGKPDAEYYEELKGGPYVDQLTLDFARAAIEGEQLGANPAGVSDLLAISLSSHDYINHELGPEHKKSHDHLFHLDQQLGQFFQWLDKRIGMQNIVVVLTADHGFPNTPEFAKSQQKQDAGRVDSRKLMALVNKALQEKYGVDKLFYGSAPNFTLDADLLAAKGLSRSEVEQFVARLILQQEGVSNVYTRSQLESGALPATREARLMQRAWHRQVSGDFLVSLRPWWYFGSSNSGTSHGSPYAYDTNVPLLIMGKPWIKPAYYGQYAEVMDIAPTLAHLLRIRPPAASEGRVLLEALR
ncbi:alkaline phosphatase family protein [Massilia sp. W12]|uniref:alkaline phosphatase family protein n=1 Tax=Massilia sp. W12 TaxID=3126507 RepID=UPI0030D416E1